MNQILFIEKGKDGGSMDMKIMARIAAIIILVVGLGLIGKGVFGFIDNAKKDAMTEPVVSIREVGKELELKITHDKAIDKVVYSWNGSTETTLQGMGRSQMKETLELPVGNNVLTLKITDNAGKTTDFTKSCYRDANADITAPEIELVVEGSRLKIVVKDDKEIEKVSYYWNEEDETVIVPREDSVKLVEESIAILKGKNTLTVVATDTSGNEKVETQTYQGAKKPTISVVKEENELVIKVRDEENIKKIELNFNGEFFSTDAENTGASLDMQEAEIRQPLKQGENVITITAYNVSGLSEQVTKTVTI